MDIHQQRQVQSKYKYRSRLDALLESSFFETTNDTLCPPVVLPLNDSVLSTIAIAISPNGETIATSHGDHTIKVFYYHTGKQYRIFRGHPRTPWTVKYHPTDSNIVARYD